MITALDAIPFADAKLGIIIFAAASILKDSVSRVGELLDEGQPNGSFKP